MSLTLLGTLGALLAYGSMMLAVVGMHVRERRREERFDAEAGDLRDHIRALEERFRAGAGHADGEPIELRPAALGEALRAALERTDDDRLAPSAP